LSFCTDKRLYGQMASCLCSEQPGLTLRFHNPTFPESNGSRTKHRQRRIKRVDMANRCKGQDNGSCRNFRKTELVPIILPIAIKIKTGLDPNDRKKHFSVIVFKIGIKEKSTKCCSLLDIEREGIVIPIKG
jgi:hypothetical protein